jgi:hypothetical protein
MREVYNPPNHRSKRRKPLCITVGRIPILFRRIQVRSEGRSCSQACTQVVQGDVPIEASPWAGRDENLGGTAG